MKNSLKFTLEKTKEYQMCDEIEQAHIHVPLIFPLLKFLVLVLVLTSGFSVWFVFVDNIACPVILSLCLYFCDK